MKQFARVYRRKAGNRFMFPRLKQLQWRFIPENKSAMVQCDCNSSYAVDRHTIAADGVVAAPRFVCCAGTAGGFQLMDWGQPETTFVRDTAAE